MSVAREFFQTTSSHPAKLLLSTKKISHQPTPQDFNKSAATLKLSEDFTGHL
tara:strand:- start:226 stop:381 length:156 start_codon:yes stop_codon:yes gene_type:complete